MANKINHDLHHENSCFFNSCQHFYTAVF